MAELVFQVLALAQRCPPYEWLESRTSWGHDLLWMDRRHMMWPLDGELGSHETCYMCWLCMDNLNLNWTIFVSKRCHSLAFLAFQLKGPGAELARRVHHLLSVSRAHANFGAGGSIYLPGSTRIHEQSLTDMQEVTNYLEQCGCMLVVLILHLIGFNLFEEITNIRLHWGARHLTPLFDLSCHLLRIILVRSYSIKQKQSPG